MKKFLVEVAWETCNQVGGIYTVIRTKVPAMVEKWEQDYLLLGPYFTQTAAAEFEPLPIDEETPVGRSIAWMRDLGMEVHYGNWLITGKPKIVLFDITSLNKDLDIIKATAKMQYNKNYRASNEIKSEKFDSKTN